MNRRLEPAFWAGKSITVSPVAGNIFWNPKDGITNEREQDWVLLVVNTSWIGCPAGAVERAGEYPELTTLTLTTLERVEEEAGS